MSERLSGGRSAAAVSISYKRCSSLRTLCSGIDRWFPRACQTGNANRNLKRLYSRAKQTITPDLRQDEQNATRRGCCWIRQHVGVEEHMRRA